MNLKNLDVSFTEKFVLNYAKVTHLIATLTSKSCTNWSEFKLPGFHVYVLSIQAYTINLWMKTMTMLVKFVWSQ